MLQNKTLLVNIFASSNKLQFTLIKGFTDQKMYYLRIVHTRADYAV